MRTSIIITGDPMESRSIRRPHTVEAPRRAWWLLALAAVALAGLALHGPIAQWASYHAFADDRGWLGLPNIANVLSNLPFALAGAWGLWALREAGSAGAMPAWRCLAACLLLTAFGSTVYHWHPENDTLVLDRLPIAGACAAILAALLAERVDARWASARVLAAAMAVAVASVLYWWATEQFGNGDLRPYLAVQFMPMLLVPAALALRLPPTGDTAVPGQDWLAVLGLYAFAKLAESFDHPVLAANGLVSGHTLKHLLAAAAAAWLLGAVARAQRGGVSSGSRR